MDRISDEFLEYKIAVTKQAGYCEAISINSDVLLPILQELKERREYPEWISTKEKLPVIINGCSAELIIATGEEVFTGVMFYPDNTFWGDDWDDHWRLSEVTHWMPIPFPPKEGDK